MVSPQTSLALPKTVPEIIRIHQRTEEIVRATFKVIEKAQQQLNDAVAMGESRASIKIDASYNGSDDNFADVDRTLSRLRRDVWKALAQRLELTRIMSIADAKALETWLEKGEMQEITEATVQAFAERYTDMGSTFSRAVKEVFDFLRPPEYQDRWYGSKGAGNYKTNSLYEIGPVVFLPHTVHFDKYGKDFEVAYGDQQKMTAVERVFRILDGQGSRTKGYYSDLATAIKASGQSGKGETEYFAFKAYKNRALKLRFLRPDLLARLNQIAGGAAFKP